MSYAIIIYKDAARTWASYTFYFFFDNGQLLIFYVDYILVNIFAVVSLLSDKASPCLAIQEIKPNKISKKDNYQSMASIVCVILMYNHYFR
jgi:hypothetical protein